MSLAADAAGNQQPVILPVVSCVQNAAAAGTLDFRIRRFQSKNGAGAHDWCTALGADIAQGSHIVSHKEASLN